MSVLAAYVNRADGHAALDFAIQEAKRREALLHVAHVRVSEVTSPSATEHVMKMRTHMEQLEADLAKTNLTVEFHELFTNKSAASQIIGVAEKVASDVIVIGLRQRSPVGKLLLGSVARDVLLGTPRPVIAVPP